MSAIEQALRQIDLQRESKPAAAGIHPRQGNHMLIDSPGVAAAPPGKRWGIWLLLLAILGALLAFGLRLDLIQIVMKPAARPAATTGKLITPTATVFPPFQPDTSNTAQAQASAVLPKADWMAQASRAWDGGAWDYAARLWLEGLRRTAPSTLALQLADLQTLEQTQRMYQTWSRDWPLVILAQNSPAGPRWMVLVLPEAADVGAVQQRLARVLGQPVAWASVMQWVATAELGPSMTVTPPATALITQPSPTAPTTQPTAAAPDVPAQKDAKPDRTRQASSPSPLPAASKISATVPRGESVEPPQVNRSNGAAVTDQARAAVASKAIDVNFSAAELLLARGEFDKAFTAVEQLEGYMGSNWRTRYLAGVALSGLGRWKEAVPALTSASQKNPDHARASLYLAVALQESGDHTGAIDTLVKATASHPEMPELWLNQGHSLQALGRTEEATQAYRRFLNLSANRGDLNQQRSWVEKRLQKAD